MVVQYNNHLSTIYNYFIHENYKNLLNTSYYVIIIIWPCMLCISIWQDFISEAYQIRLSCGIHGLGNFLSYISYKLFLFIITNTLFEKEIKIYCITLETVKH